MNTTDQPFILPFSVVIIGRAIRATDNGTVEQLSGGRWHRISKKPTHQAARDLLSRAAENRDLAMVGA